MLPLGYPLIEFNLGDKWVKYLHNSNDKSTVDSNIMSLANESFRIRPLGSIRTVLVRLHPLGLRKFINDDVGKNAVFDARTVFGNFFEETVEKIAATENQQDVKMILDHFFIYLFNKSRTTIDYRVQGLMAQIITSRGMLSLHNTVKELGISQKRIEQLFLEHIGMSPKTYAGIAKFQNMLALRTSEQSLTELSLAAGYYDQSHFIKQFKSFTGCTPRDFFATEREINYKISNLYNYSV